MSTQSLDLTVVGWIGTDVRIHHESDGGIPFTTFRLGSTRRWFDKQAGVWRDAQTEWFNVKVWRTTALNAARSLRKGDPVHRAGPAVDRGVGRRRRSAHLARARRERARPQPGVRQQPLRADREPDGRRGAGDGTDGAPADVSGLEELAGATRSAGRAPVADDEQELALAGAR